MKKVLYSFILLLVVQFSKAQHFGLEAGSVFSTMNFSNDVIILNTNLKPGFLAGVTVDFPLNENMLINASVGYKSMGTYIQNGSVFFDDVVDVFTIRTDNLYLNTSYDYLFVLEKIDVFIEGGAYLGYGFGGNWFYNSTNGGEVSGDIVFSNEEDDENMTFKPLDIGLLVGGGVYYNHWRFGAGYQFGLSNLNPSYNRDGDDTVINNGMAFVKVGYFFNRPRK